MMTLVKFACAAVLAAGISAANAEPVKETTTTALKNVDAVVQKGVDGKLFPGAVLIIGKPGKVMWAKAYGKYTYAPDATSVTLNTLFDMASCSKVMGPTMATMRLADQGKIRLTDPVTKYIPDWKNGKEKSTVLNLMTHTSGLPPYLVHSQIVKIVEAGKAKGMKSNEALIAHYASLKPSADPGTTYAYSCLNMQTMASIDEKIAGESLDKFLKQTVWGECEMTDTTYFPTEEQIKRTAPTVGDPKTNEVKLVGKVHDPLASGYITPDACPGNAGVFSTAEDVAKFCEMIANKGQYHGKQVLSKQAVKEMSTVRTAKNLTERTPGWGVSNETELNKRAGARCLSHTGYTGTMAWIDTRTGTYMVLLTNRVFPDDKTGVGSVRSGVIRAIQKANPEYAKLVKDEPETSGTRKGTRRSH